ncbi:hypothetical protein M0Q97_06630 [Candidatus Dojkabacteria bacterium]|jgi:hypothetical protein|nr:hypothetical protein [Candidatus Dojkabacteria bacterium]
MKNLNILRTFEEFVGFSERILWYDFPNAKFLNNTKIKNIEVEDLDILRIEVYEPSAYYYKWNIKYKGKEIENNSGTIQGFANSVINNIKKINKKLSYKEPSITEINKLYDIA